MREQILPYSICLRSFAGDTAITAWSYQQFLSPVKGKTWRAFRVDLPFENGSSGSPVFTMYGQLIAFAIARKNGQGIVMPVSGFMRYLNVSQEGNRLIAERIRDEGLA